MAQCVRRLEAVARAAIAAVGAERFVAEAWAAQSVGALDVWAVGKAAAAMARGAARAGARRGLVIGKSAESVPHGFAALCGGHPIPDARSVAATQALADAVGGADSPALLLLSGGASALIGAPLDGVSLDVMQAATRALVLGGAPIGEINTVRRHLGALLGGRLAAAAAEAGRARLDVWALSDVAGDDPAAIGSGPASPDPTTLDDARRVAQAYALPPSVHEALARVGETPKPGDACFARVYYRVLATPATLQAAAADAARAAGWVAVERAGRVAGDFGEWAGELVAAAATLGRGQVLVAVGEPTVRVAGDGRGGRAQHLALWMARALAGTDLAFVACGSDGSDGPTDAAGAAVDGTTWTDAGADALARWDAHTYLNARGATLVTGSTGTNLTDLFLLGRS